MTDTTLDPHDVPPVVAPVMDNPPPDASDNADDFEFVRLPNGKVVAVPKADIAEVPETAKQDLPKSATVEVIDPHFYVWLANGDVVRVKQSDLPAPAGTNAPLGHWQIGGKVYLVVNVVPVEEIVKGEH